MRHTRIEGLDKGNAQGIIMCVCIYLYSYYSVGLCPEKISICSCNLTTA